VPHGRLRGGRGIAPDTRPRIRMNGRIIIEAVRHERESHAHRIVASIVHGDRRRELFFAVAPEYGEHLEADRADCFVVGLLAQAAMDGNDIESRVPVSEHLLFQINAFLCGVLGRVYRQRAVSVSAPATATVMTNAGAVGTGLTCGVDSLYTVCQYSKTEYPAHNLTHLCLFNVGGHHIAADEPKEIAEFRGALARRFCAEQGYAFVEIDSNLHDFAPHYSRYYSLLNAAAVLALPKLFARYYSSSGYSIDSFYLTGTDLAHFETFVLDAVSGSGLKFYSTGAEVSRFEKVKALIGFAPSYRYLNVCNTHAHNCGVCIKCLRTLYALDVLDALDKYRDVFDVDAYRRNRARYLAECWVRALLARDSFAQELYPLLKAKYRVPMLAKLRAAARFIRSRTKRYRPAYIRYRLAGGRA